MVKYVICIEQYYILRSTYDYLIELTQTIGWAIWIKCDILCSNIGVTIWKQITDFMLKPWSISVDDVVFLMEFKEEYGQVSPLYML